MTLRSPAGSTRLRGRWDLLLALAVAAQVLFLLVLPRVVTGDGPAHVDGAWVLLHLGDAGAERLRELYRVDWAPVPNAMSTYLLAVLMTVLGPDVSERVLVVGYAVALPLSLRYALRGVHPEAGWLAVAAVPFVTSYLYFYGFYDFCLGLVVSLVVVGFVLRRSGGWTARAAVGLALLLVLTWYCHLLPTIVACLFVSVSGIVGVLAARRDGASWRPAVVRHLVPPALAGVPVLALTADFAVRTSGDRGAPVHKPWWDLLLGMVTLAKPLVVYSPYEYLPSAVVAAVLVLLAVRRPHVRRPALAVTGLLVLLWYALSPDRYGPAFGFLNDRISFFPPLLLLLWAAGPPPATRLRLVVPAGLLGAAVALTAFRLPTELAYQRDVAEYLSVAPAVPRGSTLLSLRFWRDGPAGPEVRNQFRDPLRHESSRLAQRVGGVDVGHYEAALSYFPVRFQPATDPRRLVDPTLAGLDQVPPAVDVAAGVPAVDVVLVVGRDRADPAVTAGPAARATLDVVESRYRLVAVSPTRLVEVWQRR